MDNYVFYFVGAIAGFFGCLYFTIRMLLSQLHSHQKLSSEIDNAERILLDDIKDLNDLELVQTEPGRALLYSLMKSSFYQELGIPIVVDDVSDETRILRNLELMAKPIFFSPADTQIINGIPSPEEVSETSSGLWYVEAEDEQPRSWKTSFEELFSSEGLGRSFRKNTNLHAIVTDEDGSQTVYFPDGSSGSLNEEYLKKEFSQTPTTVLILAPKTMLEEYSPVSLIKKISKLGAEAVLVPTSDRKTALLAVKEPEMALQGV